MPKKLVVRHEVVQPPDTSYRLIPLTQGQNAIVDVEDYDWLNQWNWCAWWSPYTHSFYAERGARLKGLHQTIYMHREIMKCGLGEEADHRDKNTLNNRRYNLRKATKSQNRNNQRIRANNTSGYVGICLDKPRNKWAANIGVHGKTYFLGRFTTAKEAACAYDEAAKKYHGEFAVLNFDQKHFQSSAGVSSPSEFLPAPSKSE